MDSSLTKFRTVISKLIIKSARCINEYMNGVKFALLITSILVSISLKKPFN